MGTITFIAQKCNILRTAFAFFCLISTVHSQVTVSGAAPASNGTFTTLSLAFAAINGQIQTGNTILVTITADFTETGATALGAGTWTTLTIQPSGTRTISGTVSWGLIELSGSDNVTIDGLNSGGNSLTISNTNTSNNAATIKLWNDATNNNITNCTILGSAQGVAGLLGTSVSGGNIVFHKNSAGGTGTDNNTISNNNLGPAGATLPACLIRSVNTITSWTSSNSGNTISGNNLYDYFHASLESSAIHISAYNTGWTIENNKFFQNNARTHTTGKRHSAIFISANYAGASVLSGATDVNSFTITNNTFGFSSSSGTGTYTINGISNSILDMIYLCVGDQGTSQTNVDGNTFANISMSGTALGNGTSAPLKLINIYKGDVNIGVNSGNTFGDQTTTGSISFTTSANTTVTNIYGILADLISSGGSVTIANNNFGSITASCSHGTPTSTSVFVVSTGTTVNGLLTIRNNIIGGTVANSIQNTSSSNNTINSVVGIFVIASPSSISDNTIRNLTSAGGTGSGSNGPLTSISSVIGIAVRNNYLHTISHNTIYSLHNINATQATIVTGIEYSNGATNSVVERNMIRSLTASSTTAIINGVNLSNTSALVKVKNNMISLGLFEDGTPLSLGININGINENSAVTQANEFDFNSIQIAGSAVTGSQLTYAFYSNIGNANKKIRNNIFYNKRSNSSGTGTHFAIRILNTTLNTINYNDYQVTGTGGILGRINAANYTTLATWQAATGQDVNSIIPFSPFFISDNDLHLQTTGNNPLIAGITITGILGDIDPNVRFPIPTIGADEINSTIVLPISLFGFHAQCLEDKTLIQWSTASEKNNHLFTIQRSNNGIDFENIGSIEGAGNSSNLIEYSFIDSDPGFELNYYRLKQIDYDGVHSYSSVVSSHCEFENSIEITIYPNPSSDQIYVRATEEIYELKILNDMGSIVLFITNEQSSQPIDITLLPTGVYYVIGTTQKGNSITTKLVKM